MLKVMTEASGGLTSGYIIKAIRQAGFKAVASDIDDGIAGRYLADEFVRMPRFNEPNVWSIMLDLLDRASIDVVLPSFDETLLGWAERKKQLENKGKHVIISEPKTIEIFQDKWNTYNFFVKHGIPTPATSLEQRYSVIKPRMGRGGKGILFTAQPVSMDGMIAQEPVKGEEYTIDVLCDVQSNPVYIIPRKRWSVRDGKSTGGMVVYHREMIEWVEKICSYVPFIGPINVQCFLCSDGSIQFIEINPRLAGGMALGFAASDNWIAAIVNQVVYGNPIDRKPIQYGLKMFRYYDEIFV